MPALTNFSVEQAKDLLDDMELGLLVVLESITSSDYPAGTIINSDPVQGVKLEKGQTVTLFVSAGADEDAEPEMVQVPKVTGMQLNEAISELQAANLGIGEVKKVESDKEVDEVIGQSVSYGDEVEAGTKINLEVSLGPAEEEEEQEEETEEPDEPTTPTEPETPTTPDEPTTPSEPTVPETPTVGSARVNVKLPDQEGSVRVTLMLDGQQISDDEDIPCEWGSISANLTGTGTMTLDVYYDGVWAYSEQVTFE